MKNYIPNLINNHLPRYNNCKDNKKDIALIKSNILNEIKQNLTYINEVKENKV
jgi:hypothetical protein